MMQYSIGSLVKVRGRDWVVQPSKDDNWYILQPLGGSVAEQIAVSPQLESIEPATFALPDPKLHGDATSGAFLRDAVRLGFRSTTGPFRSFGRIAVEPRPYQLVPLLMAMKQAVVRILIADDVGIGKTVEAGLIVRELMDRGEISRMTVLCPPQLAEQWQDELASKFHIAAELVLPSTVAHLEKGLGGTSLFDVYPYTIVSLDYIKSDRHRPEFLRVCPECVIVDEAHSCATSTGNRSAKQRFSLIQQLAGSVEETKRHMIFVTATPHSGKDDVFHSLLSFLRPDFANLPEDLSGTDHEEERKELAKYFIQRRRADIKSYMDAKTAFPVRVAGEITWSFSPKEQSFFQNVLNLARESVQNGNGQKIFTQHIFLWSALALLRAVSSSPAAAKSTLKNRAIGIDSASENVEQLDREAREKLFDMTYADDAMVTDTLAGSDSSSAADMAEEPRTQLTRRYQLLAQEAEALEGSTEDSKLAKAVEIVEKLLSDGYSPIIFCRFIHTAEYVKRALEERFSSIALAAVTGVLPPEERENRVEQLKKEKKRILVCTDCLSEGVNLQDAFNAVVHYDLSWNPTRHEQREGRVDRYGQPFDTVKVITLYGKDNPIDGYVLDVLLRKHEAIRKALGISVPFPENSDIVMQTIVQSFLLRKQEKKETERTYLPGLEEFFSPQKKKLDEEWELLAAREQKRSRTIFAQQSIKVENVAQEIAATEESAGDAKTVEKFLSEAVRRLGGVDNEITDAGIARKAHVFSFDPYVRKKHRALDLPESMTVVYEEPVLPEQELLTRTHPMVENIANYVFETALDTVDYALAKRSGVVRTSSVSTRTTLLLCRFRYEMTTKGKDYIHTDLTEECVLLAFSGSPANAVWKTDQEAKELLTVKAEGNVEPSMITAFIAKVNDGYAEILPHIRATMRERAARFLETHRRVRDAAKLKGVQYEVHPQGEPDLIATFVFLPM